MYGVQTFTEFKDSLTTELVGEWKQSSEDDKPDARRYTINRAFELFIERCSNDGSYVNDVLEVGHRAIDTIDRLTFDRVIIQIAADRLKRGEEI